MNKKVMVVKAPILTVVRCLAAMPTVTYSLRIKIVIIEFRVDLVMPLNIVIQWQKPL
jgi:hypothetical protein